MKQNSTNEDTPISQTEVCKGHLEKKCILKKAELFGHRDTIYVLKKKGEAYNTKSNVPTMKHGGRSIML